MLVLRMWVRDGLSRPLSVEDATEWVMRNVPGSKRETVESRLRRGHIIETPCCVFGTDRQAMECRRQAANARNVA